MKLYKRLCIWLRVAYSFMVTFNGIKADIISPEETVDVLLKRKSLIRFGDGEFGIYRGKDIHYQKWSEPLYTEFDLIKKEYESNSENLNYMLAMPRKYMTANGVSFLGRRVLISSWSDSRYDFKYKWRHDLQYGDSFLFEKKNAGIYSKLWTSEECPDSVIFIHNDGKYAEYFSETYHKNTIFMECPKRNAFDALDILQAKIINTVNANKWNNNEFMVVVSAGPAGKILVRRLSGEGYWCIDAGHCWDDPLQSD